jgi:hypothetical protein
VFFDPTLVTTLILCVGLFGSGGAWAVPSYAVQTGQPCAACHVGAFGPQLKQYGRDFKMAGYTASVGKHPLPPIAFTSQTSFTHTDADQSGGAAPHFAANDNLSLDQLSAYFAGRITSHVGAFAQFTYDGVAEQLHWDNADARYARDDGSLFGEDLVWGLDVNNAPTVQDVWNSTPVWGFPYISSPLAPSPAADPLIDGALGQAVLGFSAYALWNDAVYAEIAGYKGLGRDVRNALGVVPVNGSDSIDGISPYWRLALEHEWEDGRHYAELGTYGISTSIFPTGIKYAGTDQLTDVAIDANYQYVTDTKSVVSNVLSAHATFIHESLDLAASQLLFGTNAHDDLSVFRADASYSIGATWTPSVQYFRTSGTADTARYGYLGGRPDSAGYIAELAYVPWGKPDSAFTIGNLRLSVQYVGYTRFNGTSAHAQDNNTLFLNLWLAIAANS